MFYYTPSTVHRNLIFFQVPTHHRSQHDKKEQTQLSPVKKRVKEGTPPSDQLNYVNTSNRRNHSPSSNAHWQHASHQQVSVYYRNISLSTVDKVCNDTNKNNKYLSHHYCK